MEMETVIAARFLARIIPWDWLHLSVQGSTYLRCTPALAWVRLLSAVSKRILLHCSSSHSSTPRTLSVCLLIQRANREYSCRKAAEIQHLQICQLVPRNVAAQCIGTYAAVGYVWGNSSVSLNSYGRSEVKWLYAVLGSEKQVRGSSSPPFC